MNKMINNRYNFIKTIVVLIAASFCGGLFASATSTQKAAQALGKKSTIIYTKSDVLVQAVVGNQNTAVGAISSCFGESDVNCGITLNSAGPERKSIDITNAFKMNEATEALSTPARTFKGKKRLELERDKELAIAVPPLNHSAILYVLPTSGNGSREEWLNGFEIEFLMRVEPSEKNQFGRVVFYRRVPNIDKDGLWTEIQRIELEKKPGNPDDPIQLYATIQPSGNITYRDPQTNTGKILQTGKRYF